LNVSFTYRVLHFVTVLIIGQHAVLQLSYRRVCVLDSLDLFLVILQVVHI